jgi:tRNA(fMet)-specific endonuclease VapC
VSLCILDTDHVSLFLRGNSIVIERVLQTSPSDLATTIVTAEEMCQGWLSEINKHTSASQSPRLLLAYAEFQKALVFFRTIQLVGFGSEAYKHFERLRREFRRLDTRDLRIAAIALTSQAILVTRNRQDFGQIAELTIADWSTLTP